MSGDPTATATRESPLEAVDESRDARGASEALHALRSVAYDALIICTTRRLIGRDADESHRARLDDREPALTSDMARIWAAQLPTLRARGLAHITLAGGEPLLAFDAVAILSAASAQAGIANYVVSSGVWATQASMTARLLRRLSGVTHWDIVDNALCGGQRPRDHLRHLIDGLEAIGTPYTVRVGVPTEAEQARLLIDGVTALIGPLGHLKAQPMGLCDRPDLPAKDSATTMRKSWPRAMMPSIESGGASSSRPCIRTGLLVRADGSTGPSFAGQAYVDEHIAKADDVACQAEGRARVDGKVCAKAAATTGVNAQQVVWSEKSPERRNPWASSHGAAGVLFGRRAFEYGDASRPDGLLDAWRRWHDASLQRLRRLGGAAVLDGVDGFAHPSTNVDSPVAGLPICTGKPCYACVSLLRCL